MFCKYINLEENFKDFVWDVRFFTFNNPQVLKHKFFVSIFYTHFKKRVVLWERPWLAGGRHPILSRAYLLLAWWDNGTLVICSLLPWYFKIKLFTRKNFKKDCKGKAVVWKHLAYIQPPLPNWVENDRKKSR